MLDCLESYCLHTLYLTRKHFIMSSDTFYLCKGIHVEPPDLWIGQCTFSNYTISTSPGPFVAPQGFDFVVRQREHLLDAFLTYSGRRHMKDAPRDGTRILLEFVESYQPMVKERSVIEEVYWRSEDLGGSQPGWRKWCGSKSTQSTQWYDPRRCMGWYPNPRM